MNKLLFSIIISILPLASIQCNTGHAAEKTSDYTSDNMASNVVKVSLKIDKLKEKNPYSRISVRQGIKVLYTVSNESEIVLEGPQELVNRVSASIEQNTLKLVMKPSPNNFDNITNLYAYIKGPAINYAEMSVGGCIEMKTELNIPKNELALRLSSGGIFTCTEALKCKDLSVSSNSGGIVKISLLKATESVNLNMSSGSIVSLSGEANFLKAGVSSGAILNIPDLKCNDGSVNASSGAIVNYAKNNVSVSSSSGAIIRQQ